jgi:hypothetical protein
VITPALLRACAAKKDCIICGENRWRQQTSVGTGLHDYAPGEAFALDYQGTFNSVSRSCTGYILVVDLGTGYMQAYGVKEKIAISDAVLEWTTMMMSYGYKPKLARHDSGSVELGGEFIRVCGKLGINTIRSPDGIPSYEIERMVQVIQDDIKSILQAAQGLGAKDWMAAVLYAVAIRNIITNEKSSKIDKSKSPAEIITKKATRVRSLQDIKLGGIVITKTPRGKRSNIMTRNQAARVKQVNMDPHNSAEVQFL